MQDFIAQGMTGGSFEDNRLPVLIYICPLELNAAGQEMHSHPGYAELMLVRTGKGVVNVDGRQETLSAGDFVLCGAGEPHSYHSVGEEPMTGVSCGFARLMCRGMEENSFIAHSDQPVVHAGGGSAALDTLLSVLEKAALDPSTASEEVCSYLSAAVVTVALRIHRTAAEQAEQAHYELGVRTRMYLDRHYLEPLTLDGIAQAMGVSKNHLDRVFAESAGCSPVQYIIRRRMARAQTLLASTDQTIRHVAAQCGYSNYNYFTELFRRTVGMTPRDYRKVVQGRTGHRN